MDHHPGIRFRRRIRTEWHDRPVVALNGKRTEEKRREVPQQRTAAGAERDVPSDAWKLFANCETSFGGLRVFPSGPGRYGNQTANGLNGKGQDLRGRYATTAASGVAK